MLSTIKSKLMTPWNLWRIIRAVLSIIFIVNGIIKADYILLFGGVFLLIHAVMNACVAYADGNCEIPQK